MTGLDYIGDKIAKIIGWNPCRAEPSRDLAGGEVGRLRAFEGRYVAVILFIDRSGGARHRQLVPHIAAEIRIGGFPSAAFRVLVNKRPQFLLQGGSRPACNRFHAAPVEPAMLVERDGESFRRRIDMLNGAIALKRRPLENRGFPGPAGGSVVILLQRKQQGRVRIAGEGAAVVHIRQIAELLDETVVGIIEVATGLGDDLDYTYDRFV